MPDVFLHPLSKLPYMEPSGPDSKNWEMGWKKDGLNIKYFYLNRPVNDSSGNEIGKLSMEFYGYEKRSAKPESFDFELRLGSTNNNFIERFDLDSLNSQKIRDSLYKEKVATSALLPYDRFYLIRGDHFSIPFRISEFFSWSLLLQKGRSFRMIGVGSFQDNDKIRFATGDAFLDKILNQSSFTFKTKNILNIGTRIN
jgi:hypothetical protein